MTERPDDESIHAKDTVYETFDDWMDEQENYAPRALRAAEDLGQYWEKWLRTAWELGAEAERAKAARPSVRDEYPVTPALKEASAAFHKAYVEPQIVERFLLGDKDWDALQETLTNPPAPNEELKALMRDE